VGRPGVEVSTRHQQRKRAYTAGLSGKIAYIAAILITLSAAAIRYELYPIWGSQFRFITLYPAVALAAWLGGFGPGLVATIISVVCALLLIHVRVDDGACLTAFIGFILGSLFVTALYESLRRTRRLAELNSEAHRFAEERLHRIVTSASDAIITIDAEQKITLFSTGAEAIFGYSAAEMLGRPLDPLLPERFRQAHRGHIDAFGATEVGTKTMARKRPLAGLRRNGEEFSIEAQISQVEVAGQKLYTVILRDITERMQAEAEREQLLANAEQARRDAENALKVLKQMQSITDATLIDLSFDQLLVELASRVRAALTADTATVLLEKDGVLHARVAVGQEEGIRYVRIPVGIGFAGQIAKERRSAILNEIPNEDMISSALSGAKGVRSLIGVPLLSGQDRVLGVLQVGCIRPREFNRDDLHLLQLAAERVALSVERAARIEALQSRDRLEISNRRKDEFLAMLSHELRNPLSAVHNALIAASLDESRRPRALEIARRQTDQLGRLIDDLLDATRLTQGRITLRKERVSVTQILERAIESTRSIVEAGNLYLTVTVAQETLQVEADPTRLEQIFVNLLSNAAKYTEAGGRIDVIAESRKDEVSVHFRDTGIGIAPEMLPFIWDLFTQAESGLGRAQGGLGIGLTVARRLVELQGGRIQAHSEGLGKGAEFLVCLPLIPAISEGRDLIAATPRMVQQCASILLVEDNHDAAESLTILLELLGHRMRVVHDGMAAMEAARSNLPDVMLVDIGLPGMDGYEVARQVRLEPNLKRVTLIALTGYGHKEDKRRAMAAGFDYYLVKPVNTELLQKLLAPIRGDGPEKPSLLQ
jgi:PAS domain S-box-containing protein